MRTIGYNSYHVRTIGSSSPKILYIGHHNNKPVHLKSGK